MPKKILKGTIKSISGPKTVGVEVVRTFHHPQYRKRVRRTKGYLAHFEGEAYLGMSVVIQEAAPLSKKKHWLVIEAEGKPVGKADEVAEIKQVKKEKTVSPKAGRAKPQKRVRRAKK